MAATHPAGRLREGQATLTESCDQVRAVPAELRKKKVMWPQGIQPHYTKYTEAYGIPIIGKVYPFVVDKIYQKQTIPIISSEYPLH